MEPSDGSSASLASSTLTALISTEPKERAWFSSIFDKSFSFSQLGLDYAFYHGDHRDDLFDRSKNTLVANANAFFLGFTDRLRWTFSERLQ